MKKELYIFGTGPHALKIYNSATLIGHNIVGFIDDNINAKSPIKDIKVLSKTAIDINNKNIIIAIGNNDIRQKIFNEFIQAGWCLKTIIHPSAIVAQNANIGAGVFIGAGVIIESNAVIKTGTIIDIGVIIDHDCFIDCFNHIKTGKIIIPYTKINNGIEK